RRDGCRAQRLLSGAEVRRIHRLHSTNAARQARQEGAAGEVRSSRGLTRNFDVNMHDDRRERPVALVTGASSGIGEGVARRFAAGAYRLVLVARRRERLELLAKELSAMTDVEVVVADVTAVDAADRSVAAAMKAFGRLDCLVNNAGAGKWAPI